MRIYAKLEDVGTEYATTAPVKISLEPFKNCYFLELRGRSKYKTVEFEGDDEGTDWKPYNGIFEEYCWYDPETKIFGDEDTEEFCDKDGNWLDRVKEGYKCQKYVNGELQGEPYFKEE